MQEYVSDQNSSNIANLIIPEDMRPYINREISYELFVELLQEK